MILNEIKAELNEAINGNTDYENLAKLHSKAFYCLYNELNHYKGENFYDTSLGLLNYYFLKYIEDAIYDLSKGEIDMCKQSLQFALDVLTKIETRRKFLIQQMKRDRTCLLN